MYHCNAAFPNLALLTFGPDHSCVEVVGTVGILVASIPSLYPLNANSFSPGWTNKNASRYRQIPPGFSCWEPLLQVVLTAQVSTIMENWSFTISSITWLLTLESKRIQLLKRGFQTSSEHGVSANKPFLWLLKTNLDKTEKFSV